MGVLYALSPSPSTAHRAVESGTTAYPGIRGFVLLRNRGGKNLGARRNQMTHPPIPQINSINSIPSIPPIPPIPPIPATIA